jgi:transcriptional regulator with XRE-family HTH domain
MIDFGSNLKHIRTNSGLTQKQLAESTGLGVRTIQQYEANDRKPTFDALIALADYFQVSIDYLVGRSDEK